MTTASNKSSSESAPPSSGKPTRQFWHTSAALTVGIGVPVLVVLTPSDAEAQDDLKFEPPNSESSDAASDNTTGGGFDDPVAFDDIWDGPATSPWAKSAGTGGFAITSASPRTEYVTAEPIGPELDNFDSQLADGFVEQTESHPGVPFALKNDPPTSEGVGSATQADTEPGNEDSLVDIERLLDAGGRVDSNIVGDFELHNVHDVEGKPAFEVLIQPGLDGLATATVKNLTTGEWGEEVRIENSMIAPVEPQFEAVSLAGIQDSLDVLGIFIPGPDYLNVAISAATMNWPRLGQSLLFATPWAGGVAAGAKYGDRAFDASKALTHNRTKLNNTSKSANDDHITPPQYRPDVVTVAGLAIANGFVGPFETDLGKSKTPDSDDLAPPDTNIDPPTPWHFPDILASPALPIDTPPVGTPFEEPVPNPNVPFIQPDKPRYPNEPPQLPSDPEPDSTPTPPPGLTPSPSPTPKHTSPADTPSLLPTTPGRFEDPLEESEPIARPAPQEPPETWPSLPPVVYNASSDRGAESESNTDSESDTGEPAEATPDENASSNSDVERPFESAAAEVEATGTATQRTKQAERAAKETLDQALAEGANLDELIATYETDYAAALEATRKPARDLKRREGNLVDGKRQLAASELSGARNSQQSAGALQQRIERQTRRIEVVKDEMAELDDILVLTAALDRAAKALRDARADAESRQRIADSEGIDGFADPLLRAAAAALEASMIAATQVRQNAKEATNEGRNAGAVRAFIYAASEQARRQQDFNRLSDPAQWVSDALTSGSGSQATRKRLATTLRVETNKRVPNLSNVRAAAEDATAPLETSDARKIQQQRRAVKQKLSQVEDDLANLTGPRATVRGGIRQPALTKAERLLTADLGTQRDAELGELARLDEEYARLTHERGLEIQAAGANANASEADDDATLRLGEPVGEHSASDSGRNDPDSKTLEEAAQELAKAEVMHAAVTRHLSVSAEELTVANERHETLADALQTARDNLAAERQELERVLEYREPTDGASAGDERLNEAITQTNRHRQAEATLQTVTEQIEQSALEQQKAERQYQTTLDDFAKVRIDLTDAQRSYLAAEDNK